MRIALIFGHLPYRKISLSWIAGNLITRPEDEVTGAKALANLRFQAVQLGLEGILFSLQKDASYYICTCQQTEYMSLPLSVSLSVDLSTRNIR